MSGAVDAWVYARLRLPVPAEPLPAIAIYDGDDLIAGICYWAPHWPHIIVANIASTTPRWASREVLRTMFGLVFRWWGARRMHADVAADNQRSQRFLERLGFRREGHLRSAGYHGEDMIVYSMLPHECRWI